MTSPMVVYRTKLINRYWKYQKTYIPNWRDFFDRPWRQDLRPPVFRVKESWRNVIINPSSERQGKDKVLALLPIYERHKWFRSMNSSQALAQSVLGNLAVHGQLSLMAELQDDEGMPLLGETQVSAANFAMEYKVETLDEPRRTSLDAYFGGDYRVAVECKFTEAQVGKCSRPQLTPQNSNYYQDRCNGTYTVQKPRNERCSLTERGVLYWKYIPALFHWDSRKDMRPCPLYVNYQLVRNVLAVGVGMDGTVSPENGHVVVIYDERNPAFHIRGKIFSAYTTTRQALIVPTMLRKCSWQRIIKHMRKVGSLPWLTEQLGLKYGM